MATVQNIPPPGAKPIFKGDAVTLDFTLDQNPDVTTIAGWTIKFTLKRNATDADADKVLQATASIIDATARRFRVTLSHADLNIDARSYEYDATRTDLGNEAVLRKGTFVLSQGVLYP